MTVAAIIAECNPFHKGHSYIIEKAKEQANHVILLMSGNYVQRGLPAITDYVVRARCALHAGADAVFLLPVRYATGSAEVFAEQSVRILSRMGIADLLVFGSEIGEINPLREAAAFFTEEPEPYKEKLRSYLADGLSYPRARELAVQETAGSFGGYAPADLLRSPNNILGIEYLKAILKTGASMQTFTVARQYGGDEALSGSAIREALLAGEEIPENTDPVFAEDIRKHGLMTADDFSAILSDRLLAASGPDEYLAYASVTPGIAQSMFRQRRKMTSFTAFTESLHTRDRTYSAVSRALLHTMLRIPKETGEPFTRLIGFRKGSESVLRLVKERASLPVIIKAAGAEEQLGEGSIPLFLEEERVTDLYESIRAHKAGREPVPMRAREVIVL